MHDNKNWSIDIWAELEQIIYLLKQLNVDSLYLDNSILDIKVNIPDTIIKFEHDYDPDIINLMRLLATYQYRDFNKYDLYLHLGNILFDKIKDYIHAIV